MTKRDKKAKPSVMMERVMRRLREGVPLADVASELAMNELMLSTLLETALIEKQQSSPPPAPAQKPALGRRKPIFLRDGTRLGRSALWS